MKQFNTCVKNNNFGFTLLEAMTSLFVLSFVVILWLQLMTIIVKNNQVNQENIQLSLLDSRIRSDLRGCAKIDTSGSSLEIKLLNGDVVNYVQYEDKLVRKLNGKGFEPVLKLGKVNFIQSGNKIYIKTKSKHYLGQCYE